MAIKKEIIIDVNENGFDEAEKKANLLTRSLHGVGSAAGTMATGMRSSGNAVLENGGAVGVLSETLGPNVMLVKDAVEATMLFTKSQKIAAAQQKVFTWVTGASSTGLKLFRIALVSTGIGAAVVILGFLIANFDKIKKAVMNLVPGLGIIGKIFTSLNDAVTDFIGLTDEASHKIDDMVEDANASLKRSEHFLEANGDKYDEYTQRKMKANIEYNKKVKELAEDEELTDKEKLQRMADFRAKANREISKADEDREAANQKKREEANQKEIDAAKKVADENKRIADDAQKKKDEAIAKEKERTDSISKILEDFRKREEDALAKSERDKIDLEEKRAIAELDRLKATEEEKAKVRAYYKGLRDEDDKKVEKELAEIGEKKQEAERDLMLDQKQWEIDNETDPVTKLMKEREMIELTGNIEMEKQQAIMDSTTATLAEKAEAEIAYNKVKQDMNQDLEKNSQETAEAQKQDDKSVLNNKINGYRAAANAIAELAGESSAVAKGVAVAQTTIDTIQSGVSVFKGMTTAIPGPIGIAAGVVAAAGAVASGYASVKKILATKPVEKSAPSGVGAVPAPPPAPAFNLVQGTGTNQIAEAVANSGNRPLEAFVVTSNVTTGQAMERNIVESATL